MLKPSQTKSVLNELELGRRIAGGYAIMLEGFARAYPGGGGEALEKTKDLSKMLRYKREIEASDHRKITTTIDVTGGMLISSVSHIEEAFLSTGRIKEMSPHEEQKRTNDSALMQAMKLIENQPNPEAFEKIVAKSREKLDKQIASGSSKP